MAPGDRRPVDTLRWWERALLVFRRTRHGLGTDGRVVEYKWLWGRTVIMRVRPAGRRRDG